MFFIEEIMIKLRALLLKDDNLPTRPLNKKVDSKGALFG